MLERIVNTLTEGKRPGIMLVSAYFGIILMVGLAESAREGLLSVFGQRITRSLRHELCGKLSRLDTGCFVQQTPGEIVSRFVGDVDTVEKLFTGGIIGMTADIGKIISILMERYLDLYGSPSVRDGIIDDLLHVKVENGVVTAIVMGHYD